MAPSYGSYRLDELLPASLVYHTTTGELLPIENVAPSTRGDLLESTVTEAAQ